MVQESTGTKTVLPFISFNSRRRSPDPVQLLTILGSGNLSLCVRAPPFFLRIIFRVAPFFSVLSLLGFCVAL